MHAYQHSLKLESLVTIGSLILLMLHHHDAWLLFQSVGHTVVNLPAGNVSNMHLA